MVSTGSDIIRLQKRNLLFIPINEQREKLSLTELAENILGYAQINQFNTFDLIYANKNWEHYLGLLPGELIKQGTDFEQQIYDASSREKIISEILDSGENEDKVFGYFQKIRKNKNSEFLNFICFTQKWLNHKCYLTILFPVSVFGENTDILNIILEYNDFISKSRETIKLLSRRETEILHLIGMGKSRNEIVNLLNISKYTFDNHRKHIRTKLNIKNLTEFYHYIFALHLDL
jgi:DNA-binding CsgD family transcriptional regulator